MLFVRWVQRIASYRRALMLVALLTTFSGVGLLLDRPKGPLLAWVAVPLLSFGGALFGWAIWPRNAKVEESQPSLAGKILRWITWKGRLMRLFPAFGIAIILMDLAYNGYLSASPAIGTEDTIALLAGVTLIACNFVPKRYVRERDFVLMFFLSLNIVLVVPLLIARAYYADFERSVDVYSWVALAPQTSVILNLLGVANTVHPVAGFTAPGLTFRPRNLAIEVTIVITTACSGIYSFGIFGAAFIAFVATEFERVTFRVWTLLGLGLITAYLANVLRMVVIVLIGYYTDTVTSDLQNMLLAHSYAGWLIFLGWITLFWSLLFKGMPRTMNDTKVGMGVLPARPVTRCAICGTDLTPVLPATRCICGAYYHVACISTTKCPSCQRMATTEAQSPRGDQEGHTL